MIETTEEVPRTLPAEREMYEAHGMPFPPARKAEVRCPMCCRYNIAGIEAGSRHARGTRIVPGQRCWKCYSPLNASLASA